jgi:iron complex outermembrane receptor protein
MFDVELKPTSDLTVDVNGFYSRMSATNFDHSFLANTQALIEGGDIPMNTVVRNNTLVQADFPNAGGANSPGEIDSIARPGAASETWYFDINSKLHLNDAVTIKTKLGTTRGLGETPGDLGYETVLPSTGGMNYSMHGMGAPANVSFPGVNTTDFGQASLLGSWWDVVRVVDREHYAQADADWQLDAGYLESAKFGVRFTDHLRQVSWPTHGGCGFDMAAVPCVGTADWNGAQYPADFGKGFGAGAGTLPGMWLQDINSIQNYILTHGAPLEPNHVGEFSVGERTTAGYGLLNLAGDKWRGNVGARIVRTQQTVNFNVRPDENAPDEFTPVTDDRTYTDVLPSANVRLELSKNLVSRFSVARTLTRPDYSALAGAITSLDPLTKSGGGGNVDLQPVRSTNYDATLEWYFAPKSALTLGVFYMDMASYVGYGTSTHLLPNPLHANAIEEFKITSPINVKAENKGVELGYQQSLGGGFGLSANYTYADGKDADGQPLVGSSKQTYNLETYFENDAWSARMAYTQRSDYLVGLDRSTSFWAASTGNLAASVNYKINQHLSIQFDALNLNSPVLKYYGDNQDQPRAFYANGQQFFLGLRASL